MIRIDMYAGNLPKDIGERWDTLVERLEPILVKYGDLPSELETKNKGVISLIRYFGGYPAVRAILHGESPDDPMPYFNQGISRPRGYWKKFRNLSREFIAFGKELGHFPTYDEVKSARQDIFNAIYKYHGGYLIARDRILDGRISSETIFKKMHGKASRRWNFETCMDALWPHISDHGDLPPERYFYEIGLQWPVQVLRKRYGIPYPALRALLHGEDPNEIIYTTSSKLLDWTKKRNGPPETHT